MSQGGAICQDLLTKDWSPMLRFSHLIERVYKLMEQPHTESPLDMKINEQFINDNAKWKQTAKEWNKKHAGGK